MYNLSTGGYGTMTSNITRGQSLFSYSAPTLTYSLAQPITLAQDEPRYTTSAPSYVFEDEGLRNYVSPPEVRHQAAHESFLASSRPKTQFVGDASVVQEWVEEAYEKVVGEPFPRNVRIVVGTEEEIRAHHTGQWSKGILGFSLNRQGFGQSEVFVKQNDLDVLLLTIGHEIGHVMSQTLPSIHDEEAKAFAFELAWVEQIIKHNIAGLSECFHPQPANNGLHDIAFRYVRHLLEGGREAIDVFADLVWGKISMNNTLEGRVR